MTMKTMTRMTQMMSMMMVNQQPVDLQDQECHGHHLPAIVRRRKQNAPESKE